MDKTLYVIQENERFTYSLIYTLPTDVQLSFILERNAQVRVEIVCMNITANIFIHCTFRGEGSNAIIHGAYVARGDNTLSITTKQEHLAAHATSNVNMKMVLYDNAQSSYTGTIYVAPQAHGTVASQGNKNIVLSDTAHAISVPQIEVLTDDVQCFHGSAIGTFDKEQMFYAATRGINTIDAECLLVRGFFADIIEHNDTRDALEKYYVQKK